MVVSRQRVNYVYKSFVPVTGEAVAQLESSASLGQAEAHHATDSYFDSQALQLCNLLQ